LIFTHRLKNRTLIPISVITLLIAGFAAWAWMTKPDSTLYITLGWMIIIALLLWWGNHQLTLSMERMLPWSRAGNFRFFVHLALGLLYLLILVNLTYLLFKISLTTTPPTHQQIITTNFWGAVLFIPLFSIYFSLHFLKHWRKSELAAEKIQKENIRSQLSSLKRQLDPHFLFNNLNILSALVDTDTQRSKKFIEKFAEVYRALLKSKSDDLITLSEELEFIDSYMYLIRTRFDENIQFTQNLKPESLKRMIPPLTLQLLVENAIKHNLITDGIPLAIHLLQLDDDYLMVSNTLNEKPGEKEGTGSGLVNIRNRYAYFTEKPVKIIRTETHFEVHIPLLEIEIL
jgi:LytS/YehU family sensor histidine kinase